MATKTQTDDEIYGVDKWNVGKIVRAMRHESEEKIFVPEFQRDLIWKDWQKDAFFNSLQNKYPIGSLLLHRIPGNSNCYSLVDGLQRTNALLLFMDQPMYYFSFGTDQRPLYESEISSVLDGLGIQDENKGILKKRIMGWVKSKKSFEDEDGWSSFDLAEDLDDAFPGVKQKYNSDSEVRKRLGKLLGAIETRLNVEDCIVPIIFYYGPSSELHEIYTRMNQNGTTLSKYQVFAASWSLPKYSSVEISNDTIRNHIFQRYDYLNSKKNVKFLNSDVLNQKRTSFNIYEYIYGLGKFIRDEHPWLFGSTADKEEDIAPDSSGFNLLAVCLLKSHDINDMEHFPDIFIEKITTIGLDVIEKSVEDSICVVQKQLFPVTKMKANKKFKGTDYSATVYHAEFQILALIGKVFINKYSEDFKKNRGWNEDADNNPILRCLAYRYLYEIITDEWRGSGNSRLIERLGANTLYDKPVTKKAWTAALDKWSTDQIYLKERGRALKNDNIVFLKYIYSRIITTAEAEGIDFDLEHLVPVAKLNDAITKMDKDTSDRLGIAVSDIDEGMREGLPINHIGNMALIPSKLNRSKKEKTIYQYYDDKLESDLGLVNKLSSKPKRQTLLSMEERIKKLLGDYYKNISEIERYTFTTREDLAFCEKEITRQAYEDFIKARFNVLNEKFYELNGIEDVKDTSGQVGNNV